jgi:type IV pilus assembly protein PilY1
MKRDIMKHILRTLTIAALAGFVAWSGAARALDLVGEDTDLFLTNPSISAEVPNVLIILDNSSNWSAANQGWTGSDITNDSVCGPAGFTGTKQGDAELCAIYKVTSTLTDTVNVGVMMFNDSDGGGYVKFGMAAMNSTNRAALQAKMLAIETKGITDPAFKTSANGAYEHVLNDAFRYFNSFATWGGAGGAGGEGVSTA